MHQQAHKWTDQVHRSTDLPCPACPAARLSILEEMVHQERLCTLSPAAASPVPVQPASTTRPSASRDAKSDGAPSHDQAASNTQRDEPHGLQKKGERVAAAVGGAGPPRLPHQHFYALPEPCAASTGNVGRSSGAAAGAVSGAVGAAADPAWLRAALRLRAALLRVPRTPFARSASEREMVRAYERAWGVIQTSSVIQEAVLRQMGLAG